MIFARQMALAALLALVCAVAPVPASVPTVDAAAISITPKIDHQAKTITFDVKLFLYPACSQPRCAVTDSIATEIATDIENAWNSGLKFECYTIVVNFQIRHGQQWELRPDEVGIKVDRSAANVESETSTIGDQPTNDGSTWGSPPINAHTYAHEMGHVLGLDDGYQVVNGEAVDKPGAPHDVMSTGIRDNPPVIAKETIDSMVQRAGIKKEDLKCESGWKIHIEWTDSYDGVFDTVTFDGIIDTVPPDQPPSEQIYMTGIGTATGSRKGWKLCNPGIDVAPNGTGPATFQGFVSTDTLSFSAFANIDTGLAGVSTGLFVVPIDGGTFDVPKGVSVGDPCPHYSFGSARADPFQPDTPP